MKARHSWHGSRVAHSRKEPRAGLQGLPLGQPPSSNLRSHRHSRVMPPRHGITVHGQSRNDTHGDAALPPPRAHPWAERETTLQTAPLPAACSGGETPPQRRAHTRTTRPPQEEERPPAAPSTAATAGRRNRRRGKAAGSSSLRRRRHRLGEADAVVAKVVDREVL